MSTNYSFACDCCRVCMPLATRNAMDNWKLDCGDESLRDFISAHSAHPEAISVITEHDPKSWEYEELLTESS